MKVLVTGAAGFIGAATTKALLDRGDQVVGADNMNDYYDPSLKEARLARLDGRNGFAFRQVDISDAEAIDALFAAEKPDNVINLAAQAGVRYGFENPHAYTTSNITGFLNILENCRHHGVEHLVFASSSSVYGANTDMPFAVEQNVDHPVSLYAATKKSNELLAHSYAHLFGIPTTGLRFFTVYGPWGRPDMSPFIFTKKIIAGEAIDVFNNGDHARDFTYIDDIVQGILCTLDRPAQPDPDWNSDAPNPATSSAPYRLYNIGNGRPVELMRFIECLEDAVGCKAHKNMLPQQPGDVARTFADVTRLEEDIGYRPTTSIEDGTARFVEWYRTHYGAA